MWSENVPVYLLFIEQSTQWNYHAMGGATGLNLARAHRKLDRMGLSEIELSEWEDDLLVLECAALAEMRK